MTSRFSKIIHPGLLFFALTILLPVIAHCNNEEEIAEKRTAVAMRMIGHEVLMCLGDTESRVLPIEKINNQYKIPFEFEFGFDPDDIITIIDDIVKKTGIARNYLVEIEQCDSNKVVHSFEIGNEVYSDMATCKGRGLPVDCYNLLISILDGKSPYINLNPSDSKFANLDSEQLIPEEVLTTNNNHTKSNTLELVFLILPLFVLIGYGWFMSRKKNPEVIDPNLISLGAFRFDKRNMRLTFQNNTVNLSNKEAELLALLHTHANEAVKREVLLQKVWGDDGDYVGRTLDVFISKLRKKLEADPSLKIINIRGVGYKLLLDVPA